MNLTQFKNWALSQGVVCKCAPSGGGYCGECVSLINQYLYQVFGIVAGSWGHAYAWANDDNPNREYLDKVSSIKAGDIIVYGTNFTPIYGHIVLSLGGSWIIDQNGHKSKAVAEGALYSNYSTILRHKGEPVSYIEPATIRSLSIDFDCPLTDAQVDYYSKHPGGYTELYTDFAKFNRDKRHEAEKELSSQGTVLKRGKYIIE